MRHLMILLNMHDDLEYYRSLATSYTLHTVADYQGREDIFISLLEKDYIYKTSEEEWIHDLINHDFFFVV